MSMFKVFAPSSRIHRSWLLVPALVILVGLAAWRSRQPSLQTVHPRLIPVVQTLAASAQVGGRDESEVGAEISQRLASLEVVEGQEVQAGQLLARLDSDLLRAQVRQAQAALTTARAQLELANRLPLPSEFAALQAETLQAQESYRSQADQAARRLQELQNGPTSEEIEQARGLCQAARVQVEQTEREARRMQRLVGDGFVTQQESERAQTAWTAARANLHTAAERLRQLQLGTRLEVIEQARAQLRQAQGNLRQSAALRQARLENLAQQPRREEIKVARAHLEEARWNLQVAQEKLAQAEVRAPYHGLVTRIYLKAGQNTAVANPILRLVRLPALELRAEVDENNLGRLQTGQLALVSCDAYAQKFSARLREVAPQVENQRGTVQLKLDPLNPPSWLRPGQTVSINLQLEPERKLLVLPLSCLNTVGKRKTVLRLRAGQVEEREVEVGASSADGFPVLSGLSIQDEILVDPTQAP